MHNRVFFLSLSLSPAQTFRSIFSHNTITSTNANPLIRELGHSLTVSLPLCRIIINVAHPPTTVKALLKHTPIRIEFRSQLLQFHSIYRTVTLFIIYSQLTLHYPCPDNSPNRTTLIHFYHNSFAPRDKHESLFHNKRKTNEFAPRPTTKTMSIAHDPQPNVGDISSLAGAILPSSPTLFLPRNDDAVSRRATATPAVE